MTPRYQGWASWRVDDVEQQSRARCPGCGIPTVPDHEDLTREEMLCERCHAAEEGTAS